MLTRVGTIAIPCAAKESMVSGSRPVACSMQSVPAAAKSRSESGPKQWAVVRAPSSCAAATASLRTSAGQQGSRSPVSRSIQSPTSLTQPSPAAGLDAHPLDELLGLDLPGVVADVAPGASDVPPGSDDLGQVVALVDPAGVGGRPGVPDEQGAVVAVGDGLRLGGRVVDGSVPVEPDVAVGVDHARDEPAAQGLHVVPGAGGALEGDPAARPPTPRGRTSSGPTRTSPTRCSTDAVMAPDPMRCARARNVGVNGRWNDRSR